MKVFKALNISGALLDDNQFFSYIEKIAVEHNLKKISDKNTYPIYKLKEDFNFILETYNLLNKHLKLGIKIHSAGEWILDNFYIIEENVKMIEKEIKLKDYRNFEAIATGKYKGFARIYVLAAEIVAFSDCNINYENIKNALIAYQNKKVLSIEEIEKLPLFFKIVLISKIKEICERIYSSQIQKYKAESIINRLIEKKQIEEDTNFNKKLGDTSKFAFVEYMSYRLKKYGKTAIDYQKILEEEVSKLGLTVSDIIQKEHFYIANLKITLGNSIKSIKNINRINMGEVLEQISITEQILKKDPAEEYSKMDVETKNLYRSKIQKIANKAKVSEIYVTENILKLADRYKNEKRKILKKKSHVGYYIIDDGINELEKIILKKNKNRLNKSQKFRLYVGLIIALTFVLDFCLGTNIYLKTFNNWYWLISFFLFLVPVSEIVIRTINYLLQKFKKPTIMPRLNYESGIPKELSTFIVIPCILKDKEKVKQLCRKLEVYYLANKYDNLYFAILGDCSKSNKLKEDYDEEIIKTGLEEIKKLNEKYKGKDFNRFQFLYRKRTWNDSESAFIGWERKRGLLATFNLYIKNKIKNDFLVNTIEQQKENIPNIKYIITLDSDTNLVLNTVPKLIGAMNHILNRPIIENKKVISGYGIMQPRISLDMENSKKTKFIEIFSGPAGIDFYSNAISDLYQDVFGEGIFTGKGIYDVDVYNEILEGEIPENTVLSHDLLEGNFLRCGLISNVVLLDGYPKKYIPYILRAHRWIRGDWQIIKWIKNKRLNLISKFKIFDNLRRSTINIFALILLLVGMFVKNTFNYIGNVISLVALTSIFVTYILDIIDYVVFKESRLENDINASKKFSKDLNWVFLSIIKGIISLAVLPYEAYKSLDAIIRSLYRMKKKKKLLEWITAEESEKNSKSDLISYYKEMFVNVFLGIILLFHNNILINLLGAFWILAPYIMYYISIENNKKINLNLEEKKLLLDVGKRTWGFFEDIINEENHYLMVDNYQEERIEKLVDRTSSTNIGLEILSVISAYDLGYINKDKAIWYLKNIINTIKILPKWNGHLYNWYNTKTLEPLIPRYISTVDSGNFIGYLMVAKQFLIENKITDYLYEDINSLIENTNFSVLYNNKIKLFSIGFNIEENKLTDSYYDFLASEARQASLIAIAKKDVPEKHWNTLSRTLTTLNRYKGLVSWTGTAFEYLMPNIIVKKYEGSLLDESSKFALFSQINYCRKFNLPWGISESAYNLKDLNYNYQYKAFGVPWLGLKRGLEEDLVISPYSTFLGLEDTKKDGISNIKRLIDEGSYGKYGFYEAIDYTPKRLSANQKRAVVKTYMAHHQGLILNSINNYINSNILIDRFGMNPEIEAIDILLQERMPKNMIITKQKKDKISKFKTITDSNYFERKITSNEKLHTKINVLLNENYQIITDNIGESCSKYKNNLVYEYKKTSEKWQGINIYIKNLKSKKIIDFYKNTNVIYNPDKTKYIKTDNNIKAELKITVDPNKSIEIRNLEITNTGNYEELIEIIEDFVPILSNPNQEYLHPAFNKMFVSIEEKNGNLIVARKDRNFKNNLYLATTLYTENEQIGDFEYEIDREKYLGRQNFGVPKMILENENFSTEIGYKTDYIIAMKRTLKITPGKKVNISLIISTGENKEEVIENLIKIKANKEIEKVFDISKVRAEEEMRYLQVKEENAIQYYNLLDYILDKNFAMKKNIDFDKTYSISNLWKFGISGDLPIVLIKPKKLEDMFILEEIIDAYLYYRSKKIYLDLIIINEENDNKYVKNGIEEIVLNKQISHLKNVSGGIYIFDKNNILEEYDIFEFKAKIIIENIDTLKSFLKSIKVEEKEEKFEKENFSKNENEIQSNIEEEYNNGYGQFSEDGKEYLITVSPENKLPSVWSNILANKFFGTLVTDDMGGFAWNKNSRLNRLTAWSNDPILNFPSEIIYLKDENLGQVWTLNHNINSLATKTKITYGFGYARYLSKENNIEQETIIFVPNNESFKVTKIKLRNTSDQKKVLKILVYIKNVLGEDEIFTNSNINLLKYKNYILARNCLEQEGFENKIMFITSNLKIKSFTGEKQDFFGRGDFLLPEAVYKQALNNQTGLGKDNCIAIECEIELQSYEEKQFYMILGQESSIENIEKNVEEYNIQKIEEELLNTRKNWDNILSAIKIKIPDNDLEKLLNGWTVYQTISSRLYAKSSFFQSGGAFGFRDQMQDCLSLKYIDANILKEQIINCARHQFAEGDVLHWWHEETKRGIRTKFSDDLLWLVYGVIEYIEFTGDYTILDEKVEYLKGNILGKNEDEKYDIYYKTEEKDTIYNHCIRALEKGINLGQDGIPKIGSGDWNDGFSSVGNKGERTKCMAWIFYI